MKTKKLSLRIATFAMLTLMAAPAAPNANANVIVVSTTIQAAVDAAQPGDTVLVPPGTYRENVRVTKNDIAIEGSVAAVLDGTGLAGSTGISVAPLAPATLINGFTLSGLTIQNYSRSGVRVIQVDNFHISHGHYRNNDEYGIFPILSTHGLIEFNQVSGSDDTGIYVGQSREIAIRENQARDCTIGIEIENSSEVDVQENTASENSTGIVIQVLPGLAVPATTEVAVTNNWLLKNNRPNPVSDPTELLSRLPSGVGLINIAGDRVRVTQNRAIKNKSAGIVVTQLPPDVAALDPRINPFPDHNEIRDNVTLQNGGDPDPKITPWPAPVPGSDLLWDFSGIGNCWAGNIFRTSFPALPACS